MKIDILRDEITRLREKWRQVRGKRLILKESLLKQGITVAMARRERDIRILKKEQRAIFVRIRQMERLFNRLKGTGHGK